MRLTLRAMLAYIDGILQPEDAQDIAKQIEESKGASKIYHHIRDVMRRLRLAAPGVTEGSAGPDANTVAEYLDNALADDRVPEFEKLCLESDVNLAEVASCHQILTLVLGEPAEIDPAGRERMYQLPQVAAQLEEQSQAAAGNGASGDGATDGQSASRKARPKPTVPEYLRDPPKNRRLQIAAGLALVGCLAAVLLLMAGRPLVEKQWNRWFAGGEVDAVPEQGTPGPGLPKDASPLAVPPPQAKEKPAPGKEKSAPEPVGKPGVPAPVVPDAGAKEPPRGGVKPVPEVPVDPAKPPLPGPVEIVKLEPKLPGGPDLQPPVPGKEEPSKLPPAKPVGPPPVPPLTLGRNMSLENQIILQLDPADGAWQRLPASQALVAGQRLVALPTYRAKIALGAGVSLQLLGGTQIEFLPGNAASPPGLNMMYGRITLEPLTQPKARLRLAVGSRSGVLTLTELDSVAALEVVPVHTPGANPEREPLRFDTDLYAARGEVMWEEAGRQPLRIPAPAMVAFEANQPPAISRLGVKDVPRWIAAGALSKLDDLASGSMAQSFSEGRAGPAVLRLRELADKATERRREVRALATRSLGYLDQFEPMVAALKEAPIKSDWQDHVDNLRAGVARGPHSARAIAETFQKLFGDEDGPALYRLLWGYSDSDLKSGQDARLVKYLDHELFAFRALAFANLREITGLSLYYRPELPAAGRRRFVSAWRERLNKGVIRMPADGAPAAEPEPTLPVEKPEPPLDEKEKPSEKPVEPPAVPKGVAPEPVEAAPLGGLPIE